MVDLKLKSESHKEYREHLTKLAAAQREFIKTLEQVSKKYPQLTQDIAEVVAVNKVQLGETNNRLRGELRRELSISNTQD